MIGGRMAMKTVYFNGELTPNGQITVPPEIAQQVPPSEKIQVVLHWGASEDDAWRVAGRQQFEAAYADDDSVYEALIDETSTR
jgi:hypothetical protein